MVRWIFAALLWLTACGSGGGDWRLAPELEGGWKLTVLPPSRETFELVQRLAPRKSQMAGYEGPGGVQVRVAGFALANGSAAFEQVQKWQARPGRVVFHHGPWFVIVEGDTLDIPTLSKVAGAVEKTMPD